MRIITLNVNGIRSACIKGFFPWMLKQKPDVVCLQETKAQEHQLTDSALHPDGYHSYFHDAVKKGYSGVALYHVFGGDRHMRRSNKARPVTK